MTMASLVFAPTGGQVAKRHTVRGVVLSMTLGFMLPARVWAQGPAVETAVAPESDPFALEVHGFVSPGFLLSTGNNYLAQSKRGSFEFAEAGINFTKPLTEQLRAGIQIFARDLGNVGNYSAKLDWFYLDYRITDWFGIRGGRVKIPFGLYNEINDIDAARAPILLPQSTYPIQNRDYLLAQTGAELYGRLDLYSAGALEYRAYGGTILLESQEQPGLPYELKTIDVPYVVGGRLLWETPLDGLRVGGSLQRLRLDADLLFDPASYMKLQDDGDLPASFAGDVTIEIPATLWIGSIEYVAGDALLALEYGRWHAGVDSTQPKLFPGQKTTVSERGYVMGAYHVTNWLQPSLYYSIYFPDVDHRTSSRASYQHDTAATLRWDMARNWLIKLEAHLMWGTALLNTQLNSGTPRDQLTRTWAVFLAKTTGYF